ncbi:MAG: hypothetical protein K0Q57_54 [Gammaproteobacteria bacterium]|nr:hypothetical protein [Gammaproteobacteria bacterium]
MLEFLTYKFGGAMQTTIQGMLGILLKRKKTFVTIIVLGLIFVLPYSLLTPHQLNANQMLQVGLYPQEGGDTPGLTMAESPQDLALNLNQIYFQQIINELLKKDRFDASVSASADVVSSSVISVQLHISPFNAELAQEFYSQLLLFIQNSENPQFAIVKATYHLKWQALNSQILLLDQQIALIQQQIHAIGQNQSGACFAKAFLVQQMVALNAQKASLIGSADLYEDFQSQIQYAHYVGLSSISDSTQVYKRVFLGIILTLAIAFLAVYLIDNLRINRNAK